MENINKFNHKENYEEVTMSGESKRMLIESLKVTLKERNMTNNEENGSESAFSDEYYNIVEETVYNAEKDLQDNYSYTSPNS